MRNENNNLIGFTYKNETYYYKKNIQEDIIGIYNNKYEQIVEYEYDAWGRILSIKDGNGQEIANPSHIAHINPFRYRSYYYDEETKLYYLNSRYFNPEWGRFINIDNLISFISDSLETNLYIYTNNNCINKVDSSGRGFLSAFAARIASEAKKVIQVGLAGLSYLAGDIIQRRASGNMFAKSFVTPHTPLSDSTQNLLKNELKQSKVIHEAIHNTIKESNQISFNKMVGVEFKTGDLYTSIGKADLYLDGYNDGMVWRVSAVLRDRYDFNDFRKNNSIGNIMNNFGVLMQSTDMIEIYDFEIEFMFYTPVKK